MASLQLINIIKRYQGEVVLDDLSLKVDDGETLVLLGPSGAGKSVMLRLIAGLIDPDEGRIFIDGHDMSQVEAEDRGIGMAFQNFALFPHMTAFDNIASPLTARRQTMAEIKSGVEAVAGLLKIGHVLDHAPRALSNGQKQRTALARALVANPPLLLLDDPLRNVDAKLRFEMRLELPRLLAGYGATVVYVTQDYKEAMALGDRIAVMSHGRFRQLGSPADIYLTPANIEIASLFGDPAINLLDVTPEKDAKGLCTKISGVRVPLETDQAGGIDKACVLGLRPETLHFVNVGSPGAIPVAIEAETPLNEKTVTLTVTSGGREILVSRPAGTPGPTGSNCHIGIDENSALLFDRGSGNRIGKTKKTSIHSGAAA